MRNEYRAVDEVEDLPVLANDVLEEELGLAAHREAKVIFEVRKALAIAGHRFQRAELEPLAPEVLRQRVRLRIAQHAPHLRGKDRRVAQRAQCPPRAAAARPACSTTGSTRAGSRARAAKSGNAPVFVAAAARSRSMRKRKSGETRIAWMPTARPSASEPSSCSDPFHEINIAVELARGHGPPERPAREIGHDPAGAHRGVRAVQVAARVDLCEAGAGRASRLRVRPADVDHVHADAVHRNFFELRLRVSNVLRSCAIRSGDAVGGGLNSRGGGTGSFDGFGPLYRAGRPSRMRGIATAMRRSPAASRTLELHRMGVEVLSVVGKRCRALRVVRDRSALPDHPPRG